MKYLIGVLFLVIAVLSFLGLLAIISGTVYVALTDASYDRYARQLALMVVFAFLWIFFDTAGAYLRATGK